MPRDHCRSDLARASAFPAASASNRSPTRLSATRNRRCRSLATTNSRSVIVEWSYLPTFRISRCNDALAAANNGASQHGCAHTHARVPATACGANSPLSMYALSPESWAADTIATTSTYAGHEGRSTKRELRASALHPGSCISMFARGHVVSMRPRRTASTIGGSWGAQRLQRSLCDAMRYLPTEESCDVQLVTLCPSSRTTVCVIVVRRQTV
jgi:hypothetical protein